MCVCVCVSVFVGVCVCVSVWVWSQKRFTGFMCHKSAAVEILECLQTGLLSVLFTSRHLSLFSDGTCMFYSTIIPTHSPSPV